MVAFPTRLVDFPFARVSVRLQRVSTNSYSRLEVEKEMLRVSYRVEIRPRGITHEAIDFNRGGCGLHARRGKQSMCG
jgi:hypothetical protein